VHEAHLFECIEFLGEPMESEEMKPAWFDYKNIPYDKMWPADQKWLPLYLEGRNITGRVHFSKDNKILSYNLSEIKTK
jgi:8-oxo-dGTP diphosphatase / 2-hydroxy-dATP diphosphatase